MNFDKPPQNEKVNESLEKLDQIQEVLALNPELAETAEKASRSYLVESLRKEKELPQDLKEYYEKHSNNKEWLDILAVYPEDLQRKIIQKRPDGTTDNVIELRERLNEEWAKVSETYLKKFYDSQGKELESLIEDSRFGPKELNKEDEQKINELISNISSWFDRFASVHIHKDEIFPDQKARETFGLKEYDSEKITLSEVRQNKEWYKKIDFFIEQYFKFLAAETKENKFETAIHLLDFAEYFIKKDDLAYHKNFTLLQNDLDIKNIKKDKTRTFTPRDMEESTRMSNILWYFANQKGLRYARILPQGYNIQNKFDNYSEPKLEVSSGAKELYGKYLEVNFPNHEKGVLWHGSASEKIEGEIRMNERDSGWFGNGFYLSSEQEYGKRWGKNTHPMLIPVGKYAEIEINDNRNPKYFGDAEIANTEAGGTEGWLLNEQEYSKKFTEALKRMGNIGARIKMDGFKDAEVVIFDPSQIYILGSSKDTENFKNWSKKK